jgi:hypothetical protein
MLFEKCFVGDGNSPSHHHEVANMQHLQISHQGSTAEATVIL